MCRCVPAYNIKCISHSGSFRPASLLSPLQGRLSLDPDLRGHAGSPGENTHVCLQWAEGCCSACPLPALLCPSPSSLPSALHIPAPSLQLAFSLGLCISSFFKGNLRSTSKGQPPRSKRQIFWSSRGHMRSQGEARM